MPDMKQKAATRFIRIAAHQGFYGPGTNPFQDQCPPFHAMEVRQH